MKLEQHQAVASILKGDVFIILPTGFGKSACYQCLPMLYDSISPGDDPSIVIVATPLKAIISEAL